MFKNTPTTLCLNKDKTKEQASKNTTLTLTKTLPKKYGNSTVDFQITLFTYKLNSQNKNYIYKIKTGFFFFKKKKLIACNTVDFQITLFTYKLDFQNKKLYIQNKTIGFFFFTKKCIIASDETRI